MSELQAKIEKYEKLASQASDVDKSQLLQIVNELKKRLPIKLHVAEESLCTSCE